SLPLPPLSAEQTDLVARMRELSRTRFAPRAARYDAESSFPHENYRDLQAAGLLPLTVPRAYGGVGADPIAYVHALREMAQGCSATALTFNMHSTITSFTGVVEGTSSAAEGVISAMIPRTDAGVKIEGIWNATGMRGTISHTIRYDCLVPESDVVGTPGSLLTIDLSGFALGYAAVYLGI